MSNAAQNWQDPVRVNAWIHDKMQGGNRTRTEQIEILIELLSVLQPNDHRILDLGCGDGAVDELLLTRFPSAYIVGLDSSSPMLEVARARLSRFAGRFTLLTHDLRATNEAIVAVGAFDAAIGVQSVHHLNADEKRRLFQWVSISLRDGGLFILADRIKLSSAAFFPYHLALWDRLQRAAGAEPSSPNYSYADHLARCVLRGDMPDGVAEQLVWMQAAGFGQADIFYRHVERAVFGGLKEPPSPLPPMLVVDPKQAELSGV